MHPSTFVTLVVLAGLFANPAICQDPMDGMEDMDMAGSGTSVWTAGRITQVTLAIIESALLTLLLIYPSIMDPAVEFINSGIGAVLSRKRRETRTALMENAAAIHDLFLDAIETFQGLDATLSSL